MSGCPTLVSVSMVRFYVRVRYTWCVLCDRKNNIMVDKFNVKKLPEDERPDEVVNDDVTTDTNNGVPVEVTIPNGRGMRVSYGDTFK